MVTPEELRQITLKLSLVLDSPESVKQQVKQITFAQKQLRAIRKELSASIRNINWQGTQASPDSFWSVLDDLAGDHKLAGHTRASNRRRMERRKKADRQPHLEIQAAIDELILEGDQLKLLAEEYFLDPVGAEARLQAEEEQRRLEEENKEQRLLKKKQRQIQLLVIAIVLFVVAFLCGRLADFSEAAGLVPLTRFFVLLSLISVLLSAGFFVFFWSSTRG